MKLSNAETQRKGELGQLSLAHLSDKLGQMSQA